MSQFENVLRGNNFIWFFATLVFLIFVIIKLIQNRIDIRQGGQQEKYREGEKKKQQPSESMEAFDKSVINQDRTSEDDTVTERWIKKVHEFQTYFMPILFPFALNVATGTTYSFLMVIFFISLFLFLFFNLWKLHRSCVENKVLIVLLENLSYFLSFFLLLNVWPTNVNPMPYVVIRA